MFTSFASAGDVGFIEDFALAKDRAAVLRQLIPGTEDYYYYHALHALNTEQYDKAKSYFADWHKRFNQSPRLTEIQVRYAILTYDRNPAESLAYLRGHLNVFLDHAKEVSGAESKFPNKLDAALYSRDTLTKMSLNHRQYLDNFEDSAMEWLAGEKLDEQRRRRLLQRLTRPDLANLLELILADLATQDSGGFGSIPIHNNLTLAQLDELLKRKPDLLNQTNFIHVYISKLQPGADDDWRHDPARTSAYLDRLLAFSRRLAAAHNSLKAHVLYHKLVFDRSQGKYDSTLFTEYLKLPRQQHYMAKKALESDAARRFPCNLAATFNTLLPPVNADEQLVRDYLKHFFANADSYKDYENYINDLYLKYLFAETKIELGLGEPEKWASLLPPEQFQQLKDRIDIDFAYTNRTNYSVDEAVSLELFVKNVPNLIVNIFEINTANYYQQFKKEVDTDINLDGLVPNEVLKFESTEVALRRSSRKIEFPKLNKAGVYVIDFIGSGKSSRALVRKGRLRPLTSVGTAGQIVQVVDERNRPVPDASVWLGGTEYKPEDGRVLLPFSTAPSRQPVILRRGDFCSLDAIDHAGEVYQLNAGMHVDREQLLVHRKATVLVRPALMLNGHLVSTKLLEEAKLRIVGIDCDGVQTAIEVPNFPIFEDRESTYEFRVPPRIISLGFTLTAKVKSLTLNTSVDLVDSHSVALNGTMTTNFISDLYFGHFGNEYIIEMLGRTGEPMAARPVNLTVKNRDFKETVQVNLTTDAKGRVMLGELKDVEWITANGLGATEQRTWHLPKDRASYRQVIDIKAGDAIKLPWIGGPLSHLNASLFELNNGTIVSDKYDLLKVTGGLLEIAGLAPGDYELNLKTGRERILIRVVDGSEHAGYVLGKLRHLEVAKLNPAVISGLSAEGENFTINFQDASPFARVHIFASRYLPQYSAFHDLGRVRPAELGGVYPATAESVYLTGRAIGDEYRYVLDRKNERKFPGNMLERPQLILNPWAKRVTETGEQIAGEGGAFGGSGAAVPARPAKPAPPPVPATSPVAVAAHSDVLDFLATAATVIANQPVKDGVVTVKKAAFGPHQYITVVVVDPLSTSVRHLSLPEQESQVVDLRLRNGLDPKGHFTQQKQVTVLEADKPFVLADALASRYETFDSLPKLYALYTTLLPEPRMAEFSFIARWPSLKIEEKQSLYSKHACHELSFFLFKKDPEFFKAVVKPYLANKRDKTFLDEWLLEADVNDYAAPWKHSRLNVTEQVLWSQRVNGERPRTARHLNDMLKLLPRDLNRESFLFDTSVGTSSMSTATAVAALQSDSLGKLNLRAGASGMPPMSGAAPAPAGPGSGGGGFAPPGGAGRPAAEPKPAADEKKLEERAKKSAEAMSEAEFKSRKGVAKDADKEKADNGAFRRDGTNFFAEDRAAGNRQPMQLYRRIDPTSEWAENNYHKLPIQQQIASLVSVNPFWIDFANHDGNGPFLSKNVAFASRNFTEVMLALAVIDLPFEAAKPEEKVEGTKLTWTPKGRAIVFHEEVKPSNAPPAQSTILVNQNFYKADDRYRDENGERFEKFVTSEFVIHTVYGCQVVVTNPTPARQKLSVLLQIPVGAMPLAGGKATRTVILDLEPYRTQTLDYTFYFPAPGQYAHFPVHVAKNETLAAAAAPFTFNVVAKPTKLDTESWDYLSQNGSSEQVIAYLDRENVSALNLDKIAWRMKDAQVFKQVLTLLQARHVYSHTLWAYGFQHADVPAIREFLATDGRVFAECGPIDCTLAKFDPVARHAYEHLEYKPLVNARAHSLGQRRQIVNSAVHNQYHQMLKLLSYRTTLTDDDKLSVVYYLLLQDRVEQAMNAFKEVRKDKVPEQMQYDYCDAYLAMSSDDPFRARSVAGKYAAHPVDRWRNAFKEVLNQLDEIEGKPGAVADAENRDARQAELASKQPSFDFTLDTRNINLTSQNIDKVTVNYYEMDVELLFSRNPFVTQTGNQFAMIKPNLTQEVKLEAGKKTQAIPLPADYLKKNLFVEVVAAGKTRALPYYANAMTITMSDSYGQVKVASAANGKALPKVYVKVYLRTADGQVKFHKDGYTDHRGRFDYASVSTPERAAPQKYSVLILSEEYGAAIRETDPPQK